MSKSIFISCVHEDSPYIDNIKGWAVERRLGDVVITHETEDNRQEGKEAIKEHIKSKIQGATFVIVLIGNDTHNHNWIEVEIELANSFHKEIICVRVPNTTGAVPALLSRFKLIDFHHGEIRNLLDNK